MLLGVMLNLWNSLKLLEDFSGPKYLALEFDTIITVSVMMKTSISVVRRMTL